MNDVGEQLEVAIAENIRLQAERDELALRVEQLQGQLPPCDGGCNVNSGPEETCSAHGRPVAEVWEIAQGFATERDELKALVGVSTTEYAVASTFLDSGKEFVEVQHDRAACERFIANPPLWHHRRLHSPFRIVSRLAGATEWREVESDG